MKTINLANVRKEFRANNGTINECLTIIYAVMNENGKDAETLKKVMPKSKKIAKSYATQIKDTFKIGTFEDKFFTDEDGKKYRKSCILKAKKCTCDMVLRFFVDMYNNTICEDKINIK